MLMPITAIHPGEHLAEELKPLEMSAAELGGQLKVPTNRNAEILNGQRAITGDTALRLGHFFGHQSGVLAESTKSLELIRVSQLNVLAWFNSIEAFPAPIGL